MVRLVGVSTTASASGSMKHFVIFGALVAVASGLSTQVRQCTQNYGALPSDTYVVGCTIPPCGLRQLEDAVVNMRFKTPRPIKSMSTLATAYLSLLGIQIPIPYPLGDNAVTCNFLNKPCPVRGDEELEYTLRMYIEPTFPVGTSLPIEFRIVDDRENAIVCIRVPITILGPA